MNCFSCGNPLIIQQSEKYKLFHLCSKCEAELYPHAPYSFGGLVDDKKLVSEVKPLPEIFSLFPKPEKEDEITALEKKLEIAKEALEFYANDSNWPYVPDYSDLGRGVSFNGTPIGEDYGDMAREALNELQSM